MSVSIFRQARVSLTNGRWVVLVRITFNPRNGWPSVNQYGCGHSPPIFRIRTILEYFILYGIFKNILKNSWYHFPSVICTDLTLTNGVINYIPNTTPILEGAVATHSCDERYELSGRTERTCQSDRTWSGGVTTCIGMLTV